MANKGQFDNLGDLVSAVAGAAMTRAFAGMEKIDAGKFGNGFGLDMDTGVPLEKLELAGADIRQIAVIGPDDVVVAKGDMLAITVDGEDDVAGSVRFRIDDKKLSILRFGRGRAQGTATVRITIPRLRKISLAGSGSVECDAIHGKKARISVAGSGHIRCDDVNVEQLKVQMLGSGSVSGNGKAAGLSLKIAGSGNIALDGLRAERARISMAGSGNAAFASDGDVSVSMAGSGNVTVTGRARCTMKGVGSGRLSCVPA